MTKKIRLTEEETDDAIAPVIGEEVGSAIDTATVKQLMKYIEAIDWKLWEMLKLMKAEAGEPITAKTETEEE